MLGRKDVGVRKSSSCPGCNTSVCIITFLSNLLTLITLLVLLLQFLNTCIHESRRKERKLSQATWILELCVLPWGWRSESRASVFAPHLPCSMCGLCSDMLTQKLWVAVYCGCMYVKKWDFFMLHHKLVPQRKEEGSFKSVIIKIKKTIRLLNLLEKLQHSLQLLQFLTWSSVESAGGHWSESHRNLWSDQQLRCFGYLATAAGLSSVSFPSLCRKLHLLL